MKKKVAKSKANFKVLPPTCNFINSITNNALRVFLQNLTPSQIQQKGLKSSCSSTAFPILKVWCNLHSFMFFLCDMTSPDWSLSHSNLLLLSINMTCCFPSSFCEQHSTNPCWHWKDWVLSTRSLRHFQQKTKQTRVPSSQPLPLSRSK